MMVRSLSMLSLYKFMNFSTIQIHRNLTRTKLILQLPRHICVSAVYQQSAINEQVSKTPNIYLKDEMLNVQMRGSGHLEYPLIWLRDNCQCPSCFNPQMQSRTIDWRDFDINVQPKTVSEGNEGLSIEWSDGHKSTYAYQWLKEREFKQEVQEHWLQNVYKVPRVPWNSSNFHEILKRFKYDSIIESDEELLQWLKALSTSGIAIIEDAPRNENSVRCLADRVGFIKRTHYGEKFEVRNKPDTTNLAYLAIPLQMHTDMPYYDYMPGVNLLQCMVQTASGGENQYCDGMWISKWLKETHPEYYSILSSTPVDWADTGSESGTPFHTLHLAPVICEDDQGGLARVNYNQWQRDSRFTVPMERVKPWYNAMRLFTRALYDPKNMIQIKSQPGEIATFDNTRLLHGRSGYADGPDAERHILGAYLDWDIIRACLRVLQRRQQHPRA